MADIRHTRLIEVDYDALIVLMATLKSPMLIRELGADGFVSIELSTLFGLLEPADFGQCLAKHGNERDEFLFAQVHLHRGRLRLWLDHDGAAWLVRDDAAPNPLSDDIHDPAPGFDPKTLERVHEESKS